MSNAGSDAAALTARAAALRAEFDRAFAAKPPAGGARPGRFLGVRLGGDPFALPLGDVAGLYADRKVVPVPGPSPTLLGIAGFRGALVAVHDLRTLLGYGAGSPRPCRWLILVRPTRPVGLAFDQLDGHFEADASASIVVDGGTRRHIRGMTHTDTLIRPILDVASLLLAIAHQNEGNTSPVES